MVENQRTIEHVENRKLVYDAVSGSNNLESICFDESKLKHSTNESQLSPTTGTIFILRSTGPSSTMTFIHKPFSEFFGVLILILFGDGGVAQVVLSCEQKGEYQ